MDNKKDENQNNIEKKSKQIKVLSIIAIAVLVIVTIIILLKEINYIRADSDTDVSIETNDDKEHKVSSDNTDYQGDKQVSSDNLVYASKDSEKTNDALDGVSVKFLYKDNYWSKYDLTNAVYKTSAEYEEAVCTYLDQIAAYLGKEDWFQQYEGKEILYIELEVRSDDYYDNLQRQKDRQAFEDIIPIYNANLSFDDYGPKALKCTLNFNSSMFEHNSIPLVYALTNLITYHKDEKRSSFSQSLSIGLNESVQEYLGMGTASCNRGVDIHNYIVELQKAILKNGQIKPYLRYENDFFKIGSEKFQLGYIDILNLDYYWIGRSHSFVDYLIQTYGIENVIKMLDGYDESIYYLFNDKGLDGLLSDWEQFLDNYSCKMTWDEIDTYITDFKSTHGY